ncbi:hypothetical protein DPX16_14818 [Anabarilius grahami]|uniref:Uncharacterized protein n=1 Tax=Anabarilius grahami TaxID=495550 RepID=A0A3N0YA53_ANAGA|nr:hypothetical protein DPX16_14818 [Anabarilius grahami]
MERRNDAFDEFLIDPVPQAAHSSLSLSERFSVTNALSEKRHEDLLDMLINEEAAPPLQLGCPKQHFHNDVSSPSVHQRQPGESKRGNERENTTLTMGPGRGQTSVLNYEDRANPSTPPAYEFQLLVYVQDGVKRKAQWRRAEVGGTNQLNKRPVSWHTEAPSTKPGTKPHS